MDSTFETVDRFAEMKGRDVVSSDGEKIGTVEDIYYDEATRRPEWIGLGTGFLGMKRVVVPAEGASISGDGIHVPFTKDQVKDSPGVDDDEISVEREQEIATYYGLGYSYTQSDTGLPTMSGTGPVDVESSMATAPPSTTTPAASGGTSYVSRPAMTDEERQTYDDTTMARSTDVTPSSSSTGTTGTYVASDVTTGTSFDSGVTDTSAAGDATESDVGRFERQPDEGEAGPRGNVGGTNFGTSTAGGDVNRTTNVGGTTFGDYQHGDPGHRVRRWTGSDAPGGTGDSGFSSSSATGMTAAPAAGLGETSSSGTGVYTGTTGFSGQAYDSSRFDDWRGRDVYASDGDKIGEVSEIYVDEATGQPEWVGLDAGFLGTKRVVVPFRSASMTGDRFEVPFTKDRVKDAPGVDDEQIGEDQERELCTYFGVEYSHAASPSGIAGASEGGFDSRHRRWWGEHAA